MELGSGSRERKAGTRPSLSHPGCITRGPPAGWRSESVPGTHTEDKSLLDPSSLSPKPEAGLEWKSSSPGEGAAGLLSAWKPTALHPATSARASGRSRQKSASAATSWCLRGVQPTSSRPQPSPRWSGIRRLGFQKSGSAVHFFLFLHAIMESFKHKQKQ